jgi:hypothetical protein
VEEQLPRSVYSIPAIAGATASVALAPGGQSTLLLPLWLAWLEIARGAARDSADAVLSDASVDVFSAKLNGLEREASGDANQSGREVLSGLVAIAAAAHGVDGFYGTLKAYVSTPSLKAKRSRKILEALKVGFAIGPQVMQWKDDLDWLFELRDSSVHHAEAPHPLVITRQTAETEVWSGEEVVRFGAQSAQRAVTVAMEIVGTCLRHPKPSTREWAASRLPSYEAVFGDA